jgi:glycosyltransferase involved in cell wall biosynthesis
VLEEVLVPAQTRKIVFIANVPITLSLFAAPIAHVLQEQGWETIAVGEDASVLDGFDRYYDIPPFRRRGLRASIRAFFAIRRVLLQERPDIAHLHSSVGVAIGRIAAASTRTPSVAVVHGTFLEPRSLMSVLFSLAETPFAWLSGRTVVVNSDDARFYIRICRRGTVRQAPAGGAGVNMSRSRPERHLIPTVLYIGRWTTDKNLDFLVGAWQVARQQEPKLRLRLVGRTVEGEPPWLPPEVTGIDSFGWTDDPTAEIGAATVLATTSRREGFTMVVAEAVCLGTPVVAVANRGTREILLQATIGIELVSLDIKQFSDALISAVRQESLPERFDLLSKWGVESVTAFHVDVINELIETRL